MYVYGKNSGSVSTKGFNTSFPSGFIAFLFRTERIAWNSSCLKSVIPSDLVWFYACYITGSLVNISVHWLGTPISIIANLCSRLLHFVTLLVFLLSGLWDFHLIFLHRMFPISLLLLSICKVSHFQSRSGYQFSDLSCFPSLQASIF